MNTADKRQYNLRSKLVAAVAMLLISCIMMVSATYAWFTLSTAPEVQGITTTVGANGNLEIALSYHDADPAKNTSSMGDANKGWAEKNFTWGNLLNLSDNSVYGLGRIALKPAALNVNGSSKDDLKVADNPLSIPVYAADGRPQTLNGTTVVGSMYTLGNDGKYVAGESFTQNKYKGVRAIGTADSMTEWEVAFSKALSDLTSAVDNSKSAAQNSLNEHGSVLAGIMVDYGLGMDNKYGTTEIGALGSMLGDLGTANAQLLEAIKAAVYAEASSKSGYTEAKFAAAKELVNATDAVDALAKLDAYKTAAGGAENVNSNIIAAATVYSTVANDLGNANSAYNSIKNNAEVKYADLSNVLSYLMNTTGVSVNGKPVSGDKEALKNAIADDVMNGKGVTIILGDGSGLYATLGAATGNLAASVKVPPVTVSGFTASNLTANIVTQYEPVSGGYIPAVKTTLAAAGPHTGDSNAQTAQVISDAFGYMVDFMFRTNASGSNLMLQTTPEQRVYDDSTSTATQGGGSTMTFSVDESKLSAANTKKLMEAVTVVFMDTETNAIYGIGKLDMATSQLNVVENVTVSIKASLYLHNYTYTAGVLEIGAPITGDKAPLCGLNANQAKAVSVMVFLDGEKVTNAEVANGELSTSGTLNLQFASSATLQPMQNTALKEMQGEGEYTVTINANGSEFKKVTVTAGNNYSIDISSVKAQYDITEVSVTKNGTPVVFNWENNDVLSVTNIDGNYIVNVTGSLKANP